MTYTPTNLAGLVTLIYLRKSRADLEAEASGAGDTLARHRARLLDYAKRVGLSVGAIYEEVVSGDTIASRPKMQQLLTEVEAGMWQAVLVIEVPRLARGDTADQGIVANAFKYSGTLILTPEKTYDPDNEYDEEYFEFGLFMSRREYKAINRRLRAGQLASMREGKYTGSVPPYGYEIVKLKGEKGNTLVPVPEQAKIVKLIYRLYLEEGMAQNAIATHLNSMGVPTARGGMWRVPTIRDILRNAHYAGYTSNGFRPTKKVVRDGKITITRPKNLELELYEGRHEALVTKEQYHTAVERLKKNRRPPVRNGYDLANPLSGLILCEACGAKMQRRNSSTGAPPYLLCRYAHDCGTVSNNLEEVEQAVIDAIKQWLADFTVESVAADTLMPELPAKREAIADLDKQLAALASREQRAFELVETNVYTPELFAQRHAELQKERAALMAQRAELQADINRADEIIASRREIIPRMQHVIDTYYLTDSNRERNDLLRTVLEKVTYHKTTKAGRGGNPTDLRLTIYPKVLKP